ncbi:MAG: hypothetical protein COB38_05775 [Gammaproteobacteria bacterium]|nr:MAG: hypothetical protein COB38_05775 [Gammaproteobacteria bacterium]
MNNKTIAVILTSLLVSPIAMSQDAPSYSYGEIAYKSFDFDSFDTSGVNLKGSLSISDNLFIIADYSNTSGSDDGFDFDLTTQGYGLGANFDLSNGGSWYVSYSLNTWDFDGFDVDVNTSRVGYRQNISKQLELNISITSNDIEGDVSESGNQIGLVYSASDSMKVTAEYETLDDIDMVSLGLRFNF